MLTITTRDFDKTIQLLRGGVTSPVLLEGELIDDGDGTVDVVCAAPHVVPLPRGAAVPGTKPCLVRVERASPEFLAGGSRALWSEWASRRERPPPAGDRPWVLLALAPGPKSPAAAGCLRLGRRLLSIAWVKVVGDGYRLVRTSDDVPRERTEDGADGAPRAWPPRRRRTSCRPEEVRVCVAADVDGGTAVARALADLGLRRTRLVDIERLGADGLRRLAESDFVVTCTGGEGLRLAAGVYGALYARVVVDLQGAAGRSGASDGSAEVRVLLPGDACALCSGAVRDLERACLELRRASRTRATDRPWRPAPGPPHGPATEFAVRLAARCVLEVLAGRLRSSTLVRVEPRPGGATACARVPIRRSPSCPVCGRAGRGRVPGPGAQRVSGVPPCACREGLRCDARTNHRALPPGRGRGCCPP
jgi:hypothetical protein